MPLNRDQLRAKIESERVKVFDQTRREIGLVIIAVLLLIVGLILYNWFCGMCAA